MARLLQAIQKYGPRVIPGPTVPTEELAAWTAARSGVDVAAVRAVLWDLGDAVAAFNRSGASVRLQGLGRFRPTIGRAGILRVRFAADAELRQDMEVSTFTGEIQHRDRIGIDDAAYKRLWDDDHPNDPLEL